MSKLIRIGIDTSKNVFQLHGVYEDEGKRPLTRKLQRRWFLSFLGKLEPTLIGMEACAGSHYWAREIGKLGHRVVLIPPQHAKPYVNENRKNDHNDAEGICEAISRPRLKHKFVPPKSVEQQSLQMLMKVRESLIVQRTEVSNRVRGLAYEFGFFYPRGLAHMEELFADVAASRELPELASDLFLLLKGQYRHINAQLREIEARMRTEHRRNELSQRLAEVPSIGPVGAMVLAAKATEVHRFRSARDYAAWAGLTPKDHSTAGKLRLGVITKAGDEMLRSILVVGATSVINLVRAGRSRSPWLNDLVKRKEPKLAAVALANKTARIAWKLMISGERYRGDYMPGPVKAVDMWATPVGCDEAAVGLPT